MDTSSFSDIQQTYPDAELLPVGGFTCDCYRVKLYGKFHFMKRLKPELRTDPRYVSALQKEFETGYRLDHPHLVRYVSKGEDCLLTEYVDGENLKDFIVNHPDYFKSRKNADRFLSQLLDVVGYLHQHQIVHLDLKPENILITRIGHEVKLTDLGFCYTHRECSEQIAVRRWRCGWRDSSCCGSWTVAGMQDVGQFRQLSHNLAGHQMKAARLGA